MTTELAASARAAPRRERQAALAGGAEDRSSGGAPRPAAGTSPGGADPRAQGRRPAASWQSVGLAGALFGLALGGLLQGLGHPAAGRALWTGTAATILAPTLVSSVRALLDRRLGVDLVAVLAIAIALVLGEALAAVIIAVMLTGGAVLEQLAVRRARRSLTALLGRAPRSAHRCVGDAVVTVDVAEVAVGDRLLIKPGEVIPADGLLVSSGAVLDESALTGEARPVEVIAGSQLHSGGSNAGGPFEMRVTLPPGESTYAGIVRLVSAAEQSRAPFVRLADRYAAGFLLITLVLAGLAWLVSHDPVRALAVLVVATPCPLILAAPTALISGVSHAARHGILIKGGGPLEALARVELVLLDKTGTITAARPQVVAVESLGALSTDEIVRLAASVELVSVHPFAPAIVAAAQSRALVPRFPVDAREQMGTGISGEVDGRHVAVGQLAWVIGDAPPPAALRSVALRTAIEGSSAVYVSVDRVLVGALIVQDPIRPEAPRVLRQLRRLGIRSIHMVTGDHRDVADLVADAVGIDRVFAERTPQEKVEVLARVGADGVTAMIGDGVNDAPALALADVGVAIGARGATVASEAADVVLTSDRLEGLVLAIRIAQRTRRIAVQSVTAGIGLSVLAMAFAAAGYITPVAGAVLQEGIDLLVIANALRALAGGGLVQRPRPELRALARQLASAHAALRPLIEELAALAGRLDSLAPALATAELRRLGERLEGDLLPHEGEEQRTAYPLLAQMAGDEDPTGPLVQTHQEIRRLVRLYTRLVTQLPPEGPGPAELRDLRRALYGLHSILGLHFAQEEEIYSMLAA
jgi:heavy metal translocating P-type ATPase